MMRYRSIMLAAVALISSSAHATDDDAQAWTNVVASGALSGRLMGSLELVARYSDDQRRLYETELIPHIGYKLSKAATMWIGYNYNNTYRGPQPTIHENRIREQLNLTLGTVAGGSLASRTLLEQRFRNTGNDTGWRLRQQLKWTRPFHQGGKAALVLWHDSFISFNDTDWGQVSGYNRMRNFIGVGVPLSKPLKAEIGYVNQYDFRKNATDRVAHAASVTVSYAF